MSIKINGLSNRGIEYTWTRPGGSGTIDAHQFYIDILENGKVIASIDRPPDSAYPYSVTSFLEYECYSAELAKCNLCESNVVIRLKDYISYSIVPSVDGKQHPNYEPYTYYLDDYDDFTITPLTYLINISEPSFVFHGDYDKYLEFNWSLNPDLPPLFGTDEPFRYKIYYSLLTTNDINAHKQAIRNKTYPIDERTFDDTSGIGYASLEEYLLPGKTYYALIGIKLNAYSGGTYIDYAPQLITFTPPNIKFCNANGKWVSARAYLCVPTDGDPVFREINLSTAQML